MTLSRRVLVARALAAGLSASSISLLLDACGHARPSVADSVDATLGPIEGELHIYNWSDYIAIETVAGFTREFGVRVTYDTYESNEEMMAKLVAGGSGYDLIFPTSYLWPVLRQLGLIQLLKRRYLPQLDQLVPTFRHTPNDPREELAVPYAWGMTGIAWRRDKLATPPTSWATFHEAALGGKLTMMDEGREVLGAFLRYRGHSLNSIDPAELAAAKVDALAAKPLLKAFLSAPVKAQLVAGEVWAAQLWNGDTFQALAEQERSGAGTIAFSLPAEGGLLWLDGMAVTSGAANPRAAHEFINYCLRPAVAARNAAAHRYGVPNLGASALLPHPIPFPDTAELARLEYQQDVGAALPLWDRAWTEVKAG